MTSESSALDHESLAALREMASPDQPGFLKQLLSLFIESAPEKVRSIQAAANAHDFSAIARDAHTLKSSSGNVGALALAQICQKIEKAARSSDAATISTETALLSSALDRVLKEISELPEMQR